MQSFGISCEANVAYIQTLALPNFLIFNLFFFSMNCTAAVGYDDDILLP